MPGLGSRRTANETDRGTDGSMADGSFILDTYIDRMKRELLKYLYYIYNIYIIYIVIFYFQSSCIAHEKTAICHLPSRKQFSLLAATTHHTEYQHINTHLASY